MNENVENAIVKTGEVDLSKLNDRQRAFVEHYCSDGSETKWNATRSAIAAGYSEIGAQSQGSNLLRSHIIRAAIDARLNELAMSANEVLARLGEHARGDIINFIDTDGRVDLSTDAARARTRLVKKVRVRTQSNKDGEREISETEIELYDAQQALVHLGRHHKLFTDKVQIDDSAYRQYLEKLQQFLTGNAPIALIGTSDTQDVNTQDMSIVTQDDELHKTEGGSVT